ncbi:UvrD-helicase domain-containing protein [Patescibacteria group bacterium]|nr:UvrD-helicase domain-containing protein [Patescibacteria group bacterium]
MTDGTLLNSLNPAQKKAVLATDGPILILAGAGSGKTRVLTYKVAYLILEKEIPAGNILMVTFTNKAAGEMKDRITSLLKKSDDRHVSDLPFAGTFHSLCARILRRHGRAIGITPDFLIYDSQDTKDAIKEVLENLGLDQKRFHPPAVTSNISQAKNELISAIEYQQIARGYFQENIVKVYIEYQKLLRESNALDFDDLLFFTVELFRKDKETAGYYQNLFKYVLVDEYQDTNHAQYELTRLLSKRWRNICVVGDASQSIYAWRGADFRNILRFKEDFPDCKVFHLEQNYRSTQTILSAAYSIVSRNNSHPILKLWTEKSGGELITSFQARNEQEEALFVIGKITESKYKNSHLHFSDFAVLYRTNAQSRVLEEALLHTGLPYILVGGVRFYERKEIKDVLSYLRLLINPKDSISYRRIEKLGKKKMARFMDFAGNFRSEIKKNNLSSLEVMDKALQESSYLDLYDKNNEEDLYRLENIKELRSVASQFPNLNNFLENVALVEQEYLPDRPANDNKKDAITLMTLHAAKGLEFRNIFMVGMEEGLFPHARSIMEPMELEEERRLCYVGITRAMDKLYLTYTSRRLYFGQRSTNPVSRFLLDIPQDLVQQSTEQVI